MAAPRRRRHRRSHAAAPRRHRRHGRRRNPFSGGELALAFISGGIGFAVADFLDRYLATYDPSAYQTAGATLPTDRFTGGNGTQANTLNIASPPSMIRIGAGVGVTAAFFVGAKMSRGSMAKAALQGAGLGAGIKLFSTLWNAYVIGKLLKPAAGVNPLTTSVLGLRVYPAELTAQMNLAASPVGGQSGQPFNPALQGAPRNRLPAPRAGQLGDVGPFAQQPAANAPPAGMVPGAPAAGGSTPSQPQPMPAPRRQPDGPCAPRDCGCLGDQLPAFLGLRSAA